jgi:VanZ family protein
MLSALQWSRPWGLALLSFYIGMLALGSLPGQAEALSAQAGDKLLHGLAYGFMTVLGFHAVLVRRQSKWLATLLLIAVLGLVDEALQILLPYRSASWLDWLSDVAAALVVLIALSLFHSHFDPDSHA